VIVDNKIYGGRCEGIFVIEGGEGFLNKFNRKVGFLKIIYMKIMTV
jgi:hypothetical protein